MTANINVTTSMDMKPPKLLRLLYGSFLTGNLIPTKLDTESPMRTINTVINSHCLFDMSATANSVPAAIIMEPIPSVVCSLSILYKNLLAEVHVPIEAVLPSSKSRSRITRIRENDTLTGKKNSMRRRTMPVANWKKSLFLSIFESFPLAFSFCNTPDLRFDENATAIIDETDMESRISER